MVLYFVARPAKESDARTARQQAACGRALARLSLYDVERIYREAYEGLCLSTNRLPSQCGMQELVTAWKQLRKWLGPCQRVREGVQRCHDGISTAIFYQPIGFWNGCHSISSGSLNIGKPLKIQEFIYGGVYEVPMPLLALPMQNHS